MKTRLSLAFILGGGTFWVPVVFIELLTKHELNAIIGTVIPLGGILVAYFAATGSSKFNLRTRWTSIMMLAGIYLFGPTMMSIAAMPRQSAPAGQVWFLLRATINPAITIVMATYDGTVVAILLAAAAMIFLHIRFERHRWTASRASSTGH